MPPRKPARPSWPRWISLCLLALALATFATAARADDGPLVKALRVPAQDIFDDGHHLEHRVLLELVAGVDAAALGKTPPVIVRVLRDHVDESARLIGAFGAELRSEGRRLTLVVTVLNDALIARPGTYQIDLELSGVAADAGAGQTVTVELTHPAALLRAPNPIVIERRLTLWGADLAVPDKLEVVEVSGVSRAGPLIVTQLGKATGDDGPLDGELRFSGQATAAPGDKTRVAIEANDGFPVGVTHGNLRLEAPQLKQPLEIAFELRKRYWSGLIVVLFVLGGSGGLLFRDVLKRLEARLALKAQADELTSRARPMLTRLKAAYPPLDLQPLAAAMDELDEKSKGGDGEATRRAIEAAGAALEAAVAARTKSRHELLVRLGEQLAGLRAAWILPPALGLDTARELLDKAQESTGADADRVIQELDRKARAEMARLADLAWTWAAAVRDELEELEKEPTLTAELAPRKAPLLGAIDAIPADERPDQPFPIGSFLQAVHTANRLAGDLARTLRRKLEAAAGDAAAALGAHDQAHKYAPGVLEAIGKPPAEAIGALEALQDVAAKASALRAAMRDAMTGAFAMVEGQHQEIDAALGRGSYAEAVEKIAPRSVEMGHSFLESDLATPPPVAPPPPPGAPVAAPPPDVPVPSHVYLRLDDWKIPLEAWPAQVQLDAVRVVRAVGAALLGGFATWVAYRQSFMGTPKEVFAIFFAAFTTDFAVDSVVETLRGAAAKKA